MCRACFRFVSIGDMCGIAQMESAIDCHIGMHCIGICIGTGVRLTSHLSR